jgi:hypothetical protein
MTYRQLLQRWKKLALSTVESIRLDGAGVHLYRNNNTMQTSETQASQAKLFIASHDE